MISRRWARLAAGLVLVYIVAGLLFHWQWRRALQACAAQRRARGEWVEPGFHPLLDLLFDVTQWPVYAFVNWHYSGTWFATPCDRAQGSPLEVHEQRAVYALVLAFGERWKDVDLLAPDVTEQLQQTYAEFVAPELLAHWLANPHDAPGRVGSSPWPDRIEIAQIRPIQPGRYAVEGFVVERTSQGEARRVPIRLTVERRGERWLITEMDVSPEDAPSTDSARPKPAVSLRVGR